MRLQNILAFTILAFVLSSSSVFSGEAGHDHKKHTSADKPASVQKPKKPAHADHSPKHGGQFFMAPNKFHHLEGALPSPNEFRLYFYDDHTKPISAKPFQGGAKVGVQKVGPDGREMGTPVEVPVSVEKSGGYLITSVPKEFGLPIYFTTWLMFPNQKEPDLFNFTFDKVSVLAQPIQSESSSGIKTYSSPSNMKKTAMYECPMKCTPPQDKPGRCPKCGMNMEKVK